MAQRKNNFSIVFFHQYSLHVLCSGADNNSCVVLGWKHLDGGVNEGCIELFTAVVFGTRTERVDVIFENLLLDAGRRYYGCALAVLYMGYVMLVACPALAMVDWN